MKFKPQTEEEIKLASLLPPGEYDAEIGTADHHVSKTSGKESIKVDVTVYDADGGRHFVYEYLTPAFAYKWRNAAEACGLMKQYEAGEIVPEDYIGKSCKVKIAIDDKNKDFPAKNVIREYIVYGGSIAQKAKEAAASKPLDDSIPF